MFAFFAITVLTICMILIVTYIYCFFKILCKLDFCAYSVCALCY